MPNKESRSISEQIALLKRRGMRIDDELEAYHLLSHVSYYRLKGYWWDMQSDKEIHLFRNLEIMQTLRKLSLAINMTRNYESCSLVR